MNITRFAPSPTGHLHLGHVVSALFVWGLGRRLGAQVILRIEDHDVSRCRPEFERAIHDDLAWLGFAADATYRQSDTPERYRAAIETLRTKLGVYACDCSRKRVAAASPGGDELRYDGHCRERRLSEAGEVGLRVRVPDRAVTFDDLVLGVQTQAPAHQCGDLLLRDRHGSFTYQLAVVADDLAQGVTHVIRGQDLTASTGRQILLGEALGRAEPVQFAHHGLLSDASGQKLSKRFLSESVGKRRLAGEAGAVVLGEAAYAAGLQPTSAPLAAADAPKLFAGWRIT